MNCHMHLTDLLCEEKENKCVQEKMLGLGHMSKGVREHSCV